LTLILKMGQRGYCDDLFLSRRAKIALWLTATYRWCDFLGRIIKNHSHSVIIDFQDESAIVLLSCCPYRWRILRLCITTSESILNYQTSSGTTQVSVWHTRVFQTALMALAEPSTLWQRIKRDPSPKQRVMLHTSIAAAIIPCLMFLRRVALYIMLAALASGFLYFASGMWWRIRTIRMTRMIHSSQGLQLFSIHLRNTWRC
jgi:hypothetical protein